MPQQFKTALEATQAALAVMKECVSQRYDGICGEPPSWVPARNVKIFHRLRSKLLSQYSSDQIRDFIDANTERFHLSVRMQDTTPIPRHILGDIEQLWILKYAVKWGEKRGRSMLIDDKEIERNDDYARRNRDAQARRGRLPRRVLPGGNKTIEDAIRSLATRYPDYTAKEIWPLLFLELERLGAEPEKLHDLTNLRKESYEYDTASGQLKKITFGRFADLLAKHRSNKKIL